MGEDQLVAAQMSFQARLAAFHEAQARLAELDARLRRFDIERQVFGGDDPVGRAVVEAERDRARSQVDARRAAAREAHTVLRRLSGPGAEPDDTEPDDLGVIDDGYHQPPFHPPVEESS